MARRFWYATQRALIWGCAAVMSFHAVPTAMEPSQIPTVEVSQPCAAPATPDPLTEAERSISEREYEATDAGTGLQAPNRAMGVRTYFESSGARMVDREDDTTMLAHIQTLAIGRGDTTRRVAPGEVVAEGSRVEVRRAGFVEWYENSDRGLEHGYTMSKRLDGDRPLTIEVDLGGPLLTVGDDLATFMSADGRQLEYGGLAAWDAAGTPVPVHMEAASQTSRVRLVVDDSKAAYPVTVDPVLTQPAFATLMADQPSAAMGYSIAGAGDVNNDGFDDVIVGAGLYDSGQTDEGAAFVYLGGPNGIASGGPAAASAQLESNQAGAELGVSVAGAGDVNNDGYDDVIVGALYYDSGQTNEGAAFVFLGGPSGIANGDPSTAATTLQSNQTNATFGYSVAAAGDVNDDGFADVIVGAPDYSAGQTQEGGAFVFLGSPSGIPSGNPSTANTVLQSDQAVAGLGISVAGAGDTNGDGYDDVIAGARLYEITLSTDEGAAFVFLGGAAGVASGSPVSADAVIRGSESGAHLGISVAGAGDLNNDGFDDVIVGANSYDVDGIDAGIALVFNGGPFGIGDGNPSNADGTVTSQQPGSNMGISVAGVGDVNGDGYDDAMVGSHLYDSDQVDEGVALLILGSASGVPFETVVSSASALLQSDQAGARLGVCVAGLGDLNGDGYDDVGAGASLYDSGQTDEGAAFVYLGSRDGLSGHPVASALLDPNQSFAGMGFSVAGAGDVNNDGYDDVVVGAPFYDSGQIDEGEAYVFLGGPGGIGNGSLGHAATILQSDQISANLGSSVAGAGDTNGDGYDDVIVTAPLYDSGQTDEGAAFVFLGGPTGIASGGPSNASAVLQSDQAGDHLGSCAAGAGDVNNDGYDDVIVAAPFYTLSPTANGAAFVFHGGPGGVGNGSPSNADATLQSDQFFIQSGYSVAGAGDTNGDGYDDVIFGISQYNAGQLDEGAAFVFLGGPTGVGNGNPSNADATLQSDLAADNLGASVAGAGDVNGDGYDDVIVGVPYYGRRGAALVFLGGPTGVGNGNPTNADTILQADTQNRIFGFSVAGAGDVNGDGYDDLVVGTWYGGPQISVALVFLGGVTGVANGTPATAAATLGRFDQLDLIDVAGAGDVDGDGYDDIIVGSPDYSHGEQQEGSAFVYNLQRPVVAPSGSDTVGIYVPAIGAWFLRNTNQAGGADTVFTYGAGGAGLVPLHGDWDGDGDDTPGLYDPTTGAFFLSNSNAPGGADIVFSFGAGGAGYVPMVGDWNGDGTDTIGLYQPVAGTFFLRNANSSGAADLTFSFGPGNLGWKPLSGDWNGDGIDTVGLYEPVNSNFFLKNTNASGPADLVFGYGPAGAGWTPLSGDYDVNGADTVGLYNPANGFFFLKNQNAPGAADLVFGYGPVSVTPLIGDWDGN